jgi:hypothetical protein
MVTAIHTATSTAHASSVPSACTTAEVACHNRQDPYWGQLWAPGSQAFWFTQAMARRRSETVGAVNKKLLPDENTALRQLTSPRGRAERLAAWAVLDSWRTATAEQVAAFTGSTLFLDPAYSTLSASFALGLLDLGTYSHPLSRFGLARNSVYRPANSDVFDKLITPALTWPEWASVTGGMPWSSGGQYDRHNVLAAELALRAAEFLQLGAVMGEKFATVDLLAGTGLRKTVKNPDNRRADGVLIRPDGMRIAYELTASASTGFENKIRRWAQLINDRPLETSGLTVLFIAAPHPDRSRHTSADPRHEIYKRMSKVLREFPSTGADSPAARIGIAHWEEYFPAEHVLSEEFLNLNADFALGAGTGPDRWVQRDMLSDYDFTPWETFDPMAVVDNAPLLAASPHWMRRGDHTHLIGSPMGRAGTGVPHPAPVRPEAVKGRPLGGAVGNGGRAKLPPRLRIEY